ncbi:MAG: DUF2029 domain-containing protein [Sphingobacteriales bacterium]|nr:MAG: DUF2029 domain-containing protein [Sphingobacteriales bacterium]
METKKNEKVLLLALLFLFFACIFRFLPGFVPDLNSFAGWAIAIKNDGLRYVYTHSDTNYLPFYQYVLYVYSKLMGSEWNITYYINELKLFTLAFEMLGLWYIYKWTDKKTSFLTLIFVSLLNLGFSYNTILWGQVDGIFSAFIFIALYYAYKQDMFWSGVFMVLALNAKLQAIVFVPLWLLLCLNTLIDRKSIKTILFAIAGTVAMQLLILLPFLTAKGQVLALWNVITGADKVYSYISMYASGIWFLLLSNDTLSNSTDNSIYILGLSYKQTGLLMFFISSLLAMLPVMRDVYRTYKLKYNALQNRERIWLTAAIVCYCFFFFNTQMHERYCHPVVVFLTAYAFYSRRFALYILFSITYFLNLELVLSNHEFPHPHYVWFNIITISWLSTIVLIWMFIRLYTLKNKTDENAGKY